MLMIIMTKIGHKQKPQLYRQKNQVCLDKVMNELQNVEGFGCSDGRGSGWISYFIGGCKSVKRSGRDRSLRE